MGFKSTSKLNTDLKKSRFHIMDKTVHITYDLAYNKTTILEEIVKQKDLVIDNLNEKIKNLNETIVDLVSSKNR
jgi:hypothetical protein